MTQLRRLPLFLWPMVFVVIPVILLHPLWTWGTSDVRPARDQVPDQIDSPRRSSLKIPFDVVRSAVQKARSFREPKRAVCPRTLGDENWITRGYPAIDALKHLGFLTTTAGPGMQNVFELTAEGRLDLLSDTVEEGDQYVFTIARRAYDSGTESVSTKDRELRPLGPAELCVKFQWHWQPANKVGARLNLSPQDYLRKSFDGWATFRHHREGWDLVNLQLEKDPCDYMQRQ